MKQGEVLSEVTARLVSRFHPARMILFGSHSRKEADIHSDLDILVICSFQGKRRTIMTAMDRALKGLGIARDIVVLTPEEFECDRNIPGTMARPAWLEGKVIYERK